MKARCKPRFGRGVLDRYETLQMVWGPSGLSQTPQASLTPEKGCAATPASPPVSPDNVKRLRSAKGVEDPAVTFSAATRLELRDAFNFFASATGGGAVLREYEFEYTNKYILDSLDLIICSFICMQRHLLSCVMLSTSSSRILVEVRFSANKHLKTSIFVYWILQPKRTFFYIYIKVHICTATLVELRDAFNLFASNAGGGAVLSK